jgi:hypothetical protein
MFPIAVRKSAIFFATPNCDIDVSNSMRYRSMWRSPKGFALPVVNLL